MFWYWEIGSSPVAVMKLVKDPGQNKTNDSQPDKVLISLITASYNSGSTIGDTLRSIEQQSYSDVEAIFIDGNSSDDTVKQIHNSEITRKKIISEPDGGIYDAMNKGISRAKGDIIGFLNSDDFYPDKDVLRDVAYLFEDPAIDACYGDLCYVRKANKQKIVRRWKSDPYREGLFSRGWVPPHPTFYARREVYEKYGGFDLNFKIAADYELLLRMIAVHRVNAVYLPRVMVHMRYGGETNKSLSNIYKQNLEILQALKKHQQHVSPAGFFYRKAKLRAVQYISSL